MNFNNLYTKLSIIIVIRLEKRKVKRWKGSEFIIV